MADPPRVQEDVPRLSPNTLKCDQERFYFYFSCCDPASQSQTRVGTVLLSSPCHSPPCCDFGDVPGTPQWLVEELMDRDTFAVPPIPPHGAAGGRARYLLSNAKEMNSTRKSDPRSASVSHEEGFPACQDRNPITAG